MAVQPITPNEVVEAKKAALPHEVIEVFNSLIAEKWDGWRSVIKQKDALASIAAALDVEPQVVFDKNWLDVEDVYRAAGWSVKYDKPAYCETYEASFTFSKKKDD